MNPYVELVKKWLADNDSVTLEELESNEKAAWNAARSDAYLVAKAAKAAAAMADWAADDTDEFEHYKQLAIEAIARYEESTK